MYSVNHTICWTVLSGYQAQLSDRLMVHWAFGECMQAVQAVQKGDASTRAHYMAALGEWLVQQGTAKEAGKEILLGAIALLEPAPPATPKGTLACSLSTCSTATCLQHCNVS